ncbi:polyprenyl synthetase family protein [Thiomicrorhabdus xiamenensis]|uniref:Polyprenyl synthetase family protein n=1 Tax=Thiomicrorhabdus xiamenensis TaxID=2739063 RepID=A0A7D4NQQ7_9GAMM|nr:farnesyl diphosphate synthase [Thiomicrorhabdus xiamenensis]QKI89411.1 polyprenyl synthetase family protein [Thiomicrorhabdus xiamenensis]
MHTQLNLYQQRINQYLSLKVSQLKQTTCPQKLQEAIAYATLDQGKRLRPALVYACGEALNMPLEILDTPAAAVELIHCYSLVHDDLPAMDDDELRRGKPTAHIQYDEATAILVGDAQQTLAFQLIATDGHINDHNKIEMIKVLTHAAGLNGMIGGQQIDIDSAGKLPEQSALERMHQLKTGALIQASLLLGACQHPAYPQIKEDLIIYAKAVGLAFQVQDDILDITSDTETLGKPQGSDLKADKSTYPKLLGLRKAQAYRDNLVIEAKKALQRLPFKSDFLWDLTDYIASREH